jgi:lysophospholipase L1-like esterase
MIRMLRAPTLAGLGLTALLAAVPTAQAATPWIAGYTLPAFSPADTKQWKQAHDYAGQTVREVVRLNTGGARLRLKFTNETSDTPVQVGRVHVALAGPDGAPIPGSDREVTFGGRQGLLVPAGAPAYSDPVALPAKAFADLIVSTYFPGPGPVHLGGHLADLQVVPGDATERPALANAVRESGPAFVSRIDVEPDHPRHLLVAVGDSITEGAQSTPGAHMSWPEQFARRVAASPRGATWSVVNAGISGNRILHDSAGPNLLARFDRDVLDLPGATAVIVLEGINDIGNATDPHRSNEAVSAEDLIAALKQVIARAHAHGLRIYGGTILPYAGASYYSPKGEAIRQAVNAWIRASHAFDAVIDFDAAIRDPADPARMAAAFDSGDHLHPRDPGYARMAAIVDLELLAAAPQATRAVTSHASKETP